MKFLQRLIPILLLIGCSSQQIENISTQTPQCEELGYACSLGEQPKDTFAHQLAAYKDIELAISQGKTLAQAATALESKFSELEAVEAHERTLIFKFKDAMPMFYITPLIETENIEVPPDLTSGLSTQLQGFIGRQREAKRLDKKVLMLSPFAWQWGPWDGTKMFATHFEADEFGDFSTIDKLENEDVTLEVFDRLADYDVIVMHTHGGVGSKKGKFPGLAGLMLSTGNQKVDPNTTGSNLDTLFQKLIEDRKTLPKGVTITCTPLETINNEYKVTRFKGDGGKPQSHCSYMLLPDFFVGKRANLENKFIYLHACHGLGNETIVSRWVGNNSAVLGWSREIYLGNKARPIFIIDEFFRLTIKAGFSATESFEYLAQKGLNTTASEDPSSPAKLKLYREGGSKKNESGKDDVYIINAIKLFESSEQNLEAVGQEILDNSSLSAVGTPGDGKHDKLALSALLRGLARESYVPKSSVALIGQTQTLLSVKIDDVERFNSLENDVMFFDKRTHSTYAGFELDLGFDIPKKGKRVDITMNWETPFGLWSKVYKNILLRGSGCSWSFHMGSQRVSGTVVGYSEMGPNQLFTLFDESNELTSATVIFKSEVPTGFWGEVPVSVSVSKVSQVYFTHEEDATALLLQNDEQGMKLSVGGQVTKDTASFVGLSGQIFFDRGLCQ